MKLLLVGLWVTLVALGTAYGMAIYMPAGGASAKATAPALLYQKTRVLNVPMVANYTGDGPAIKALPIPPDVYLLDEAFRSLYGDPTLDFTNLGRYDLGKLTRHLVSSTNDHLGSPVLKDVLIEQFSYISKDSLKR